MNDRFAVIAGGGTAGHVHPGLAVAHALVQRGHDPTEILYVGSRRGIEQRLVPEAGFDLETLAGEGIPRSVSIMALKAIGGLLVGTVQAVRLLGRARPKVILSLGGFAAIPCAVGARLRGIPVVIHEQNAVPGAANRLIGRWAKAAAVSYPDTALPRARHTGNPVRPEMIAVDRLAQRVDARRRLGVGAGDVLVLVTGGSLGALRLNRAALAYAAAPDKDPRVLLHHVIGQRDWDVLASEREALSDDSSYRPIGFEDDMPSVLAAADLVVSRAGASICAELAVVGVASILVPLPNAPGDHQRANASALEASGAAQIIDDADFTGDRLAAVVRDLTRSPAVLETMSTAAAGIGRRDAADRVAALLEEYAQ